MSEDMKKEMRKLIMLVSSIRSQDQDHWESHVEFSNQVIEFIKKIQDNINTNWEKVNKRLLKLDKTIHNSMDSLLSGINPEGVKETSKYLKEIQDSMQKSMVSMNLESIMQDLQAITGKGIKLKPAKARKQGKQPTPLTAGSSSPYQNGEVDEVDEEEMGDLSEYTDEERQMIKAYQEIYGPGHIPEHLKKKEKKDKKEKDPHLLKPSDFFGN